MKSIFFIIYHIIFPNSNSDRQLLGKISCMILSRVKTRNYIIMGYHFT